MAKQYVIAGGASREIKDKFAICGGAGRRILNEYAIIGGASKNVYTYVPPFIRVRNLIANPDFLNGTTSWTLNAQALYSSLFGGSLYCRGEGRQDVGYQYIQFTAGHIYYLQCQYGNLTTTEHNGHSASCGSLNIVLSGTFANLPQSNSAGTHSPSARFAAPRSGAEPVAFGICYPYGTPPAIYIINTVLVNLTATFGAGKEPSQSWCDANLASMGETKSVPA